MKNTLRFVWTHNNAYDSLLIVDQDNKVLSQWEIDEDVAQAFVDAKPGDIDDWDATFPDEQDIDDYGDEMTGAALIERIEFFLGDDAAQKFARKQAASALGGSKSQAKAQAARANGKKGGRRRTTIGGESSRDLTAHSTGSADGEFWLWGPQTNSYGHKEWGVNVGRYGSAYCEASFYTRKEAVAYLRKLRKDREASFARKEEEEAYLRKLHADL